MNPDEQLCVKALAAEMRVSTRFIYQMRACGFKMDGPFRRAQTASVRQAAKWIRARDFRLLNGTGVIGKSRSRWRRRSRSSSTQETRSRVSD